VFPFLGVNSAQIEESYSSIIQTLGLLKEAKGFLENGKGVIDLVLTTIKTPLNVQKLGLTNNRYELALHVLKNLRKHLKSRL
jgi:hypothetical protein